MKLKFVNCLSLYRIAIQLLIFLIFITQPALAIDSIDPATDVVKSGTLPDNKPESNVGDVRSIGIAINVAPEVQDLTEKIIDKEIELIRFNTNYRIYSTKASRLKQWRMWLYNESHFAVNNAGIITTAYARWKYWQRPQLMPLHLAIAGPTILLIGHSILAGGLLLETGLDAINNHKLKQRGFDRKIATKRVDELKTEIDKLLISRDGAIENNQSLSGHEKQLLTAEGTVLKDMKDASILEYSKFNIRASRWKAGRNTAQLTALLGATTGGFIGSLMSLEAAACRRPRFAGTSGIGFTISGALIVLNPLVTRLSMIVSGKLAAKQMKNRFEGLNTDAYSKLETDLSKLLSMLNPDSGSENYVLKVISNRAHIYEMGKELFNKQTAIAKLEAKDENRALVERLVVNSAIGGTKMAYGIQLINAGFKFQPNLKLTPIKGVLPVPKGGTNLFTKRVAEAATTFIPGTGIGILDAAQAKARGEWQIFRQHGSAAAAKKVLKERLTSLDQMEEMLKTNHTQQMQ